MIVCICNRITEVEVRQAARCGATCPRGAYRSLGHEPQCCACLEYAREIIDEERAAVPPIGIRAA